MKNNALNPEEISRVFLSSLSCSRSLFTTLNRAMEFPNEKAELASQPLAGGLVKKGHQCGMLWGSTLAAGAESFRRFGPSPQAEASAVAAAEKLVDSFKARTGTLLCGDITNCNFESIFGGIKYMVTGKANECRKLAIKWAPEAFESIHEAFCAKQMELPPPPYSCAAMTARKMGAGDAEAITVAGFAGGIGLSQSACGALGAAVYIATLNWYNDNHPADVSFSQSLKREIGLKKDFYPEVKKVVKRFYGATGGKILCGEITGRRFKTLADHATFIQEGGCAEIIEALGNTN